MVIGARVGASAGPSEVLVSQTVKDLVAGSGLRFADAGEHELKGVPDRWRLYRVVEQATRLVLYPKRGVKKSGLHPRAVRKSRVHPR